MLEDRLRSRLATDPKPKAELPRLQRAFAEGTLSPTFGDDFGAVAVVHRPYRRLWRLSGRVTVTITVLPDIFVS